MLSVQPSNIVAGDSSSEWLVVHRTALMRVLLLGLVLGVGGGLSVAGISIRSDLLLMSFPVTLVAVRVINLFVHWPDERAVAALARRQPELTAASETGAQSRFVVRANCVFTSFVGLLGVILGARPSREGWYWSLVLGLAAAFLGIEAVVHRRRESGEKVNALSWIPIGLGTLALILASVRLLRWF